MAQVTFNCILENWGYLDKVNHVQLHGVASTRSGINSLPLGPNIYGHTLHTQNESWDTKNHLYSIPDPNPCYSPTGSLHAPPCPVAP